MGIGERGNRSANDYRDASLCLLSIIFMASKVVYSIAVSVDNLSLFPFDLIMYIQIA